MLQITWWCRWYHWRRRGYTSTKMRPFGRSWSQQLFHCECCGRWSLLFPLRSFKWCAVFAAGGTFAKRQTHWISSSRYWSQICWSNSKIYGDISSTAFKRTKWTCWLSAISVGQKHQWGTLQFSGSQAADDVSKWWVCRIPGGHCSGLYRTATNICIHASTSNWWQ